MVVPSSSTTVGFAVRSPSRIAAGEEQRDDAVGLADGGERAVADHRLQQVRQLRARQGPARGDQGWRPGRSWSVRQKAAVSLPTGG